MLLAVIHVKLAISAHLFINVCILRGLCRIICTAHHPIQLRIKKWIEFSETWLCQGFFLYFCDGFGSPEVTFHLGQVAALPQELALFKILRPNPPSANLKASVLIRIIKSMPQLTFLIGQDGRNVKRTHSRRACTPCRRKKVYPYTVSCISSTTKHTNFQVETMFPRYIGQFRRIGKGSIK